MSEMFESDTSMYRRFSPYDEDREDADFLKSLYPVELMEIQLMVEDKCDELEYDGSIMFDAYPDKVRVLNVAKGICDKKKEYNKNLVEVLVVNEMLRRRIRRRNCRIGGFC